MLTQKIYILYWTSRDTIVNVWLLYFFQCCEAVCPRSLMSMNAKTFFILVGMCKIFVITFETPVVLSGYVRVNHIMLL